MKQPFQAIIFDMDGVIIDSEPVHERAFREVFFAMGCGETHGIDFQYYYGRSDRALWLDFVENHKPPYSLDYLLDWKERVFLKMIRAEEPIFDLLPGLAARLSKSHRLAVASGSNHSVIDAVLAMKNLRQFFPIVVSVQDVARGKPAPDVFLRAADLLGVHPAACCVIEDAAAGVEAALAAGMKVIGICNSLPAEKLRRATWVVRSYDEIEALICEGHQPAEALPTA